MNYKVEVCLKCNQKTAYKYEGSDFWKCNREINCGFSWKEEKEIKFKEVPKPSLERRLGVSSEFKVFGNEVFYKDFKFFSYGQDPKYKFPKNFDKFKGGVEFAKATRSLYKEEGKVFFCEGFFDALSSVRFFKAPSIPLFGALNQTALIEKWSEYCKQKDLKMILVPDNDFLLGETKNKQEILNKFDLIVNYPLKYKDFDDFFRSKNE